MAQYLAEIHWDGLTTTLPTPGAGTLGTFLAICLAVNLRDSTNTPVGARLQAAVQIHSFGGGPTYEWQTVQQEQAGVTVAPIVDFTLTDPVVFLEANGSNGAAFLVSPTTAVDLTILIDDIAQTVTFSGPLGTHTYSFATMGWAAGAVSISLAVLFLGVGSLIIDPAQSLDILAAFYNFYLSTNGEPVKGAQLGSLQPGSFSLSPWFARAGIPPATTLNGRTETRLLGALQYNGGDSGVTFGAEMEATYHTGIGDIELLLHALRDPNEGVLLYARVVKQHVDAVEIGMSRDNGHTWSTVRAGEVAGRFYNSPSLSMSPDGSINLFVEDRSVKFARWFKSYSYGMDWVDNGALLPALTWAVQVHPKVFMVSNGFFLVTYNTAGHFVAQLFDGGAGFGIHLQDFGGTSLDIYPGIWEDDLGRVYLLWVDVLTETEVRSTDYGVDWDQIYSAPLGTRQVVAVKSPDNAFLWKEWQDASGNLLVAGSDDAGLTFVRASVQVAAALAQQYSGLAVLPLGQVVVIPQVYDAGTDHWNISPYRTDDLGSTWNPA
jgi:hypothetical protein